MKKRILKLLSVTILLSLSSMTAMAQYVWINEKGVKQFSDKPPPASVPKSKIIKAPNIANFKNQVNHSDDSLKSIDNEKVTELEKLEKPKTIANKNEDFNKRKQEKAELEKKAKEEQQIQEENKKQCERARSYQRSLENGMLVSSTNKNGERVILDESQRAKELSDAKKIVSDCK